MFIIGVDFHPTFQQIAWVDTYTGELQDTAAAASLQSGRRRNSHG